MKKMSDFVKLLGSDVWLKKLKFLKVADIISSNQ